MTTPSFTITRLFDASRERVWAAWTDPQRLAAWFGPKETKGTVLEYDLRPGGVWRGGQAAPPGSPMFSNFGVEPVDPPARLKRTTVTFAEVDGGTRVTLEWVPLGASSEEEAFFASMMDSMTGGWTGSFDQLDSYLAQHR